LIRHQNHTRNQIFKLHPPTPAELCGLIVSCRAFATVADGPLKVCADPNNLPYSDAAGDGFENKIAALVADKLGRPLHFVWRAQRRGFLREGLNAGECDLVTGIPYPNFMVRTTAEVDPIGGTRGLGN
jgi:hypothetical protein